MKKLLILPALVFCLFSCDEAQNPEGNVSETKEMMESEDADYDQLAEDACNCVNESLEQISPDMVQVIVDSEGDETKMQELMTDYVSENPAQALEDAQIMQSSMSEFIVSCLTSLESKYEAIYTNQSEDEIQKLLLEKMKSLEDCKNAYLFMNLGMSN